MSPSPVVPDLGGLTAEIKRVAEALLAGNLQVASVITADKAGQDRVQTNPVLPV